MERICRLIQADIESGAKLLLDGRNILVLGFIFYLKALIYIILTLFIHDFFLFLFGMYEKS